MEPLTLEETELLTRVDSALAEERFAAGPTFYQTLVEADAMLKAIIPYFVPPHDRPDIPETGNPEYGALPYWARNPEKIPGYAHIPAIVLHMIRLLDDAGLIPPPTITDAEYETLLCAAQNGTAIGPDGTSWGIGPYEQLDYNWLQAPINTLLTEHDYHKAPFGGGKPAVLRVADGKTVFALAGDWGTGGADAIAVRDAAITLAPDYLIHLGDVYYTGTPKPAEGRLYWGEGEEMAHLVDFWPGRMAPGRSFTMNSNHEMYTGGRGLFEDALTSDFFRHQNGKSYFLLQNAHWQIFGLDSAYDSPDFLFMYGALNAEQEAFVRENLDPGKRTILLTHHTPYDVTGRIEQVSSGISLLAQVRAAFGGLPDYWYFGHIHDGIVYAEKEGCRMRCTGHASMPYGAPWALARPGCRPPFSPCDYIDGIEFFAGTPKTSDPAGLVRNGFMTFTLDCDQISEAFFDSDGTCAWSS